MRIFCPIFFLLALVFLPGIIHGASLDDPVYNNVFLTAPYPWSAGLHVDFRINEELCKKRYGKRWRLKCAAPVGRPGELVRDVKLVPHAPGYWQWQDSRTLVFVPENGASIRPDTAYSVDISSLPRPQSLILDKTRLSCRTSPLAAKLGAMDFYVDPSSRGDHRLTLALEFNYPVPVRALRPELKLPPDVTASAPEVVWNDLRDRATISWLVKKLGKNGSVAGVTLPGFGQLVSQDDDLRLVPQAAFFKNLPGADELFQVKDMRLHREMEPGHNGRYVLEIDTSLLTTVDQMLPMLTVAQLPEFNGHEAIKPYDWASAPAIPREAVAAGKVLQPQSLQKRSVLQSTFRFIVPAESGSYVLATINGQLEAASGTRLGKTVQRALHAEPMLGKVGCLQAGHILPAGSSLALYGNDIDAIDWQLQMVRDPFLAILAQGSSDVFANPMGNVNLPLTSLSEAITGRIDLPSGTPGQTRHAALPVIEALEEGGLPISGLVYVSLKGVKNGEVVARAGKLVLVSDLDLLVKRMPDGSLHCFSSNLNTGQPTAARVEIMGANGKVIAEELSNSKGHTVFPSLAGFSREARPVAVIASNDHSIAFMPLEDKTRGLRFADSDTGGSHVAADGILSFVFGQRGIYRPGDILHFGIISRRGDFALPPASLPLTAELLDPRGIKIWETNFTAGEYGLAELAWPSALDNISGKYILNVKTGRQGEIIGTCSARLESFLPDTLKIKVETPVAPGWVVTGPGYDASAVVRLQNLYGSPAAEHTIKGAVLSAPAQFRFPGLEQWVFTDPAPFLGSGSRRDLPLVKTDQNGAATLSLPADIVSQSSARIIVSAEGMDAAGARGTFGAASFLASPMTRIMGYKPSGSLTNPQFIAQGAQADLDFMAIDSGLRPVSWDNVKFTIMARNYVNSLISDGHGGYRYDEVPQDLAIKSWSMDIPEQGLKWRLPTDQPGEYLLQVNDGAGHVLARIPYNIIGESFAADNGRPAASKMRLRLDRSDYNSGDEINLAISLPYAAHGVISLERDGVYAFEWFNGRPGDNVAKIRIPDDFQGKGHIVASLARSEDSPVIFMTPLAYAAAPFTANVAQRRMALDLTAPLKTGPGQTMKVELKSDVPGKAIVYAVDEGILQLTNYKIPRPLYQLLEDRALDVTTLQTADLLMPRHGFLSGRTSAFGGGADGGTFGIRFQNPFRRREEPPVVMWSGIVDVGDSPAVVDVPVPAWYSGQIRIVAVAASENAVGSASAEVTATAPLILTPVLPLALAPGDSFEGSLIIANTTDRRLDVWLDAEASSYLKWRTPLPGRIQLPPMKETAIPFAMAAGSDPGVVEVSFRARTDQGEFGRTSSLSVRPGSPMRTTIKVGMAEAAGSLPRTRPVYDYGARSCGMVAAVPIPLAASLGRYLETYPYGCTEQLTSRAFAQVLLLHWPFNEQTAMEQEKRNKLLGVTRNVIASRFQDGRGVALWADGEADLLLTAYVADYLLTAREQGLGRYDELLSRLCDSLAWNCELSEPSLDAARASAYAIWVLAREGRVVTQLLENLRQEMEQRGVRQWQSDVTAVLITAAMREMNMPVQPQWQKLAPNASGFFDELAQQALTMTILSRYFPGKVDEGQRKDFLAWLVTELNGNAFGSFSAAQAIRALTTMAREGEWSVVQAKLSCMDNGQEATTLVDGAFLTANMAQCSQYYLQMPDGGKPLYWQTATTGYSRESTQKAENNGIIIERQILNSAGEAVTAARQGDELLVRLTAKAVRPVRHCVISDLLAGGLEMVIPRKEASGVPTGIRFLDRQEDRILIFCDLNVEPLQFTYRVRAVTPGQFQVPAVAAEAMYDGRISGSGTSGKLTITRQ